MVKLSVLNSLGAAMLLKHAHRTARSTSLLVAICIDLIAMVPVPRVGEMYKSKQAHTLRMILNVCKDR